MKTKIAVWILAALALSDTAYSQLDGAGVGFINCTKYTLSGNAFIGSAPTYHFHIKPYSGQDQVISVCDPSFNWRVSLDPNMGTITIAGASAKPQPMLNPPLTYHARSIKKFVSGCSNYIHWIIYISDESDSSSNATSCNSQAGIIRKESPKSNPPPARSVPPKGPLKGSKPPKELPSQKRPQVK